jgi:hypothetical protein
MGIFRTFRRKALRICPLLVVLLIAGCVGIEPYEPRDYREEGPEKDLFTGSEGEFVIFRKTDKPEADSGVLNKSDEPEDNEQKRKDQER